MKLYHLAKNIIYSVLYWVIVANYYVIVRFVGIERVDKAEYSFEILAYAFISGILIGATLGLIISIRFKKHHKPHSFSFIVLTNSVLYIGFFILLLFFMVLYDNPLDFALQYIVSSQGLVTVFHLSIFSFLFHFIQQMSKNFGAGVLIRYVSGKYFSPKEEERVFMFVDLKSSTALAEKLEHIAYSKLLQDCFRELTEPLIKYQAQIYQYVGDEIVVTWETKKGFDYSKCIDFYFDFLAELEKHKEHFIAHYNVFPEFKAGVECGKVTVAEVGELKTEIAYHGDVLNAASRIQGLCNEYGEKLLLSESMVNNLGGNSIYTPHFIGEMGLKGRVKKARVYSVEPI